MKKRRTFLDFMAGHERMANLFTMSTQPETASWLRNLFRVHDQRLIWDSHYLRESTNAVFVSLYILISCYIVFLRTALER